jgi:hypothetical protein
LSEPIPPGEISARTFPISPASGPVLSFRAEQADSFFRVRSRERILDPPALSATSSTNRDSRYYCHSERSKPIPSSAFAPANASLIPQPSARPPASSRDSSYIVIPSGVGRFLPPRSLPRTRRPAQSRNLSSRVPLDKSDGHPKALFGIKARPPAPDEATRVGEWMWVRVNSCDDLKQLVFGSAVHPMFIGVHSVSSSSFSPSDSNASSGM